jgi:enoyl-CoA hydratase/carnithine racemase
MPPFPSLPPKAAYLHLSNPSKCNALSLSILRSLRTQLHSYLTSPISGRLLTLPPFQPSIISSLEIGDDEYRWLLDADTWREQRRGLPNVIVLRSEGPVFSSGHDLKELRQLSHEEVKETFAICAEVMSLIRRSPAIVVGAIQGLATAAGAQLALTTDLPIAMEGTRFQLPGASIGLPCSSPVTAVSRRVASGMAFRMLALAEPVRAEEMGGAVEVVPLPKEGEGTKEEAFERRVGEVVDRIAGNGGQSSALGKWAFWTQLGLRGDGDGYEDAVSWAGRVMAVHAKREDARRGIEGFLGKRKVEWGT